MKKYLLCIAAVVAASGVVYAGNLSDKRKNDAKNVPAIRESAKPVKDMIGTKDEKKQKSQAEQKAESEWTNTAGKNIENRGMTRKAANQAMKEERKAERPAKSENKAGIIIEKKTSGDPAKDEWNKDEKTDK